MAATDPTTSSRRDLATVLGAEPPAAFDDLTDDEVDRLVAVIVDARRRHHEEIDRAEGDVVRHVPLPLRGAVKRLMG
ncbi:MAG: hypothetical protein JST64_07340 [Actinobacteria bacterium]|nr:hypothetical protein [Actinomycetota bacterium]